MEMLEPMNFKKIYLKWPRKREAFDSEVESLPRPSGSILLSTPVISGSLFSTLDAGTEPQRLPSLLFFLQTDLAFHCIHLHSLPPTVSCTFFMAFAPFSGPAWTPTEL